MKYSLKLLFKMSHFYEKFLLNNRFLDVNRIFNWNLNRDFHTFFYFYWSVNVNWFINIDRFLDNSWCWHLDSFNHFLFYFFHYLNWNFLLNFHIFWNFHDLLDNSFRSWDSFRDLYQNFHRFFNDNFFYYLLWNS